MIYEYMPFHEQNDRDKKEDSVMYSMGEVGSTGSKGCDVTDYFMTWILSGHRSCEIYTSEID